MPIVFNTKAIIGLIKIIMAIIVNNPSGESESGAWYAISLIVLIAAIVLFIIYIWPGLSAREATPVVPEQPNTTNVQIELPTPLPNNNTN